MLFVKDNCPIQLNSYLESLSYESTTKQIKFDLPLMTVFLTSIF